MKLFKRDIYIIDPKFKQNKSHYILQCLMATAAVVAILIAIDAFLHEVIIASFGATAFLLFAMPHLRNSRPRSVLGGYGIAFAIGIGLHYIAEFIFTLTVYHSIFSILGGLAVGLSLLLMTMMNAEHPPAAGIALGLVLQGYQIKALLIIYLAVIVLLVIKHFLRNWLIDLY